MKRKRAITNAFGNSSGSDEGGYGGCRGGVHHNKKDNEHSDRRMALNHHHHHYYSRRKPSSILLSVVIVSIFYMTSTSTIYSNGNSCVTVSTTSAFTTSTITTVIRDSHHFQSRYIQLRTPQNPQQRKGSSIRIPVSTRPQMDTFDNNTFVSIDDTITTDSSNQNDDTKTTASSSNGTTFSNYQKNDKNNNNNDDDDCDEMVILQKVNGRYVATTSMDHPPMIKHDERFSKNPTIIENSSSSSSSTDIRESMESEQYPNNNSDNSNNISNNAFGLDRNAEYRYSVKDWLPIMCSIFQSSTLQYTRGPIIAVMIWSFLLCTIQQFSSLYINYLHRTNTIWQQIYIFTTSIMPSSTIAHATTVTILGLLLVFRTTSAYQKFDEGRLIWERILSISRNMTRQIYLYPEFYQVRSRILQLLAAYPYFLHQHVVKKTPTTTTTTATKTTAFSNTSLDTLSNGTIRQRQHRLWWPPRRKVSFSKKSKQSTTPVVSSPKNSPTSRQQQQQLRTRKVISNELPWSLFLQPGNPLHNRQIIQQLMYAENRPLYICDEIGKEIVSVQYSATYSSMERMVLLQLLNELTEAVSECERINLTAVPLNYARHSLRGLTIWLFTLPVSLLPTYDWWTAPIMGLTAWLYYGIYQIGYIVEDPFQRTIRLTTICDTIYRDVICTEQRTSAFDDMILSGDVDGEWKDLPL